MLWNLGFNIWSIKATAWEAGWETGPCNRDFRWSGRVQKESVKVWVTHPPGSVWCYRKCLSSWSYTVKQIKKFQRRKGVDQKKSTEDWLQLEDSWTWGKNLLSLLLNLKDMRSTFSILYLWQSLETPQSEETFKKIFLSTRQRKKLSLKELKRKVGLWGK